MWGFAEDKAQKNTGMGVKGGPFQGSIAEKSSHHQPWLSRACKAADKQFPTIPLTDGLLLIS
jgi:hypothetical protein